MPAWAWSCAIATLARLAPPRRRAEWRRRWSSNVANWRVLRDRGEVSTGSGTLLRDLVVDASHERFGPIGLRRFLRGPAFPVALSALGLAAIVLATRGLATCRYLIALSRDLRLHPNPGLRYDFRGDRLFGYLAPIVVAAAVGLALLLVQRRSLRSLGCRSSSLLAFKVATAFAILSVCWIEGGHALRSVVTREGFRFGVTGLGLAIGYVIVFGKAVAWCIADQRRRCPVCLHRLVMPVTMGSWASLFDPAATELVCEDGHGSLALFEAEVELSAPDRWIELDPSWQELFAKPPANEG